MTSPQSISPYQPILPTTDLEVRSCYYPWGLSQKWYYKSLIPDQFFYDTIINRWTLYYSFVNVQEKNNELAPLLLPLVGAPNGIDVMPTNRDHDEFKGITYNYQGMDEREEQIRMQYGQNSPEMRDFEKMKKNFLEDLPAFQQHLFLMAGLCKNIAYDCLFHLLYVSDDVPMIDFLEHEETDGSGNTFTVPENTEMMEVQKLYRGIFQRIAYGSLPNVRDAIKDLIKTHPVVGEVTSDGYTLSAGGEAESHVIVMVRHMVRDFIHTYWHCNTTFSFRDKQIDGVGDFQQTIIGIVDAEYEILLGNDMVDVPIDADKEQRMKIEGDFKGVIKTNAKRFINLCAGSNDFKLQNYADLLMDLSVGGHMSSKGYYSNMVDGGADTGMITQGDDLSQMSETDFFLYSHSDAGRKAVELDAAENQLENPDEEHEESTNDGDTYVLFDGTGSTTNGSPPLMYVLEAIGMCLAEAARKAGRRITYWWYDLGVSVCIRIEPDISDEEFKAAKASLMGNARSGGNDETYAFDLMLKELAMTEPNKKKTIMHFTDGGMLTDYARTAASMMRNRKNEAQNLNATLKHHRDNNQTETMCILFSGGDIGEVCQEVFDGFPIMHIRKSEDFNAEELDDLIVMVNSNAKTGTSANKSDASYIDPWDAI